jgi:hypothetical protein
MFTRHYFRRAFTGFGVALVRRQLSPHRAMPQNTGWLRYARPAARAPRAAKPLRR